MINHAKRFIHIATLLGALWIIASIFLFIHTDIIAGIRFSNPQYYIIETLLKISLPLLVFFIGGLGISQGLVYGEQVASKASRDSTGRRTALFAVAIALASLVVYYWMNLLVNGIH